jgi:acyl-CoA synthetase (AMP-forming)/AMP-acid ligase II
MRGYLDDLTRRGVVFTRGRYRTGDVGVRDEVGWVRLVGAGTMCSNRSATTSRRMSSRRCCGRIPTSSRRPSSPVPHPVGATVPHAAVVSQPSACAADLPTVLQVYVEERVAPVHRLQVVHTAERLLRTVSGKIRRSAVTQWVRVALERESAAAAQWAGERPPDEPATS